MAAKRSVEIEIAGQSYHVKSDASDAYVQDLAGRIDQRIRSAQKQTRGASAQSLAVLTALQLMDELERERQKRLALRNKVEQTTRALRAMLAEVGEREQLS